MPYILNSDREQIIAGRNIETAGELNFLISSILDKYLINKGKNYNNINEIIGVLECAKLEFYRRIASPYEDIKIESNGDVYTL